VRRAWTQHIREHRLQPARVDGVQLQAARASSWSLATAGRTAGPRGAPEGAGTRRAARGHGHAPHAVHRPRGRGRGREEGVGRGDRWAAVLADGYYRSYQTCGPGSDGQLGHGGAQDRLQPALLHLPAFGRARVVLVACGSYHTLAVTGAGRVSCGYNSGCGKLGHGNRTSTQVLATDKHTCVLVYHRRWTRS